MRLDERNEHGRLWEDQIMTDLTAMTVVLRPYDGPAHPIPTDHWEMPGSLCPLCDAPMRAGCDENPDGGHMWDGTDECLSCHVRAEFDWGTDRLEWHCTGDHA